MTGQAPADDATLFEWLDRRQRNSDLTGVSSLLLKVTEEQRLAVFPRVDTLIRSIRSDDWWRPGVGPHAGALGLIVIGTAPTAAKAAALLTRRGMRDGWSSIPLVHLRDVLRARRLPWLGDLATRVCVKLDRRDTVWSGEWSFADALLRESGAMPPVTEAVVRCWLGEMTRPERQTKPVPIIERLRLSPYTDLLLPGLFEFDGVGAGFTDGDWDPATNTRTSTPRFAPALATLAGEGRLDRAMLLDGTIDRMLRGDRPGALRTFIALHDALAPTPEEQADRVPDYAQLLPVAPSPVATIAQHALRAADQLGRLELETLLDVSAGTLLRKEKTLVKTQLSWLDRVAGREPGRVPEILDTVAVAFGHPALEVQERALTVVGRYLPTLAPDDVARLAGHAGTLGGDLPARAAALFGTPVDAPPDEVVALPAPVPAAEMPPPITSAAELAEELTVAVHAWSVESGVVWERILAAIVALNAEGDRAAYAEALRPVLEKYDTDFAHDNWFHRPRLVLAGEAVRALISTDPPPTADDEPHGVWRRMADSDRKAWRDGLRSDAGGAEDSPRGVMALRAAEISVELRRNPVPLLVATPTHVTGSLDARVLLDRLARAEAEGWVPWRFDLEQALVRVPRQVDPDVVAQASALTGAAGRRFAEWLRTGGLPDPIVTPVEQRARNSRLRHAWGGVERRVVVSLEPAAPTGLLLESRLLRLAPSHVPSYTDAEVDEIWSVALPHHREVLAARALPAFATAADSDSRGGGTILPQLAECSGPVGPAWHYALAYLFGARHEQDRLGAVDAFLSLAGQGTPFAAGVGSALGDLGADGAVKLSRVVGPLREIHRAGGSGQLWELLAVALPLLIPVGPRGLPDLLELASQVAPAAGARGSFTELDAVAGRSGSSRAVTEAKRLRAVLNR